MIEMSVLDEMIAAGWSDVRRDRIPDNWRDVPGPSITGKKVRYDHDGYVLFVDPLTAECHSPTQAPTVAIPQPPAKRRGIKLGQRRRSHDERVQARVDDFVERYRKAQAAG
jgi:hypothetical protein